jgi:ATPase subunit of ABC transporter with duplicated ATPase domains
VQILWNYPNLLVLDEVTTHLDFDTVTALAEALTGYNGAVLLVSHDRFLIRRVIQGEWDEDSDNESDAGGEPELEERRRSVFMLKWGSRLRGELREACNENVQVKMPRVVM